MRRQACSRADDSAGLKPFLRPTRPRVAKHFLVDTTRIDSASTWSPGEVITDSSLGVERDQQQARDRALPQIAELERRQLRPLRELLIDPNNADARSRLAEIDEQIATLRNAL